MKRPDLKNVSCAYWKGKESIKKCRRALYAWFVFGLVCAVFAALRVRFHITLAGAILSICMGVLFRTDMLGLEHRCGVIHRIMDGDVRVSVLDGVEDTYLICCGEIFAFKRSEGGKEHVFDFESMTYCRGCGVLLEFTA